MRVETLHDGPLTRVVRACDESGAPVVLKQVHDSAPGTSAYLRLERERDLLTIVDGRGAPKALRVEPVVDHPDRASLVLEDVGAVPLAWRLDQIRSQARSVLKVALGAAEALAKVHECGVLHRDISPSNIVVHPDTGEVWLIDFGLASPTASRRSDSIATNGLEGTPAYLSPEQTGRMNRGVDVRSDLYALGATFYELIGASPPFVRADSLGYAHAHLALRPERLRPVVEGFPEVAIDLVMTLLNKPPEDRYQSAAGVAIDLRRIVDALDSDESLELRARVVGYEPRLPQDLVGREAECAALHDAFERVRAGGRSVAWVTGEPGIGKTALVRELYTKVAVGNGRVIEGKFDQYARDLAFAALTNILERFAHDVLGGRAEQVEAWRRRVLDHVAPNAQLLIDIAPRLAELLGPQPSVPDIAPTLAQARLDDTVRRAISSIASEHEPLVLFLDDLQWADAPSLRVIEALFRDSNLAHLLLVGAWRDTEVDGKHPLQPTVAAIAESGASSTTIHLGPLSPDDLARWIGAGLYQPADAIQDLVSAMFDKTGGNPFFVAQVIEEAATLGALRFDREALRWACDARVLDSLAPTANVVTLLQQRLERQGEDSKLVLSAAALLGESFDREAVAFATGLGTERVSQAIADAIDKRFIATRDTDYWLEGSRASNRFRFYFVHDRVQQAASELIDEPTRKQLHLAIARELIAHPEIESSPFKAAEHYCAALDQLSDPSERQAVVDLLLAAGSKAMRSVAFPTAHRFTSAAVDLVDPSIWTADRDQAVALWYEAARAAWLVGEDETMARHVATLRERSDDAITRLGAAEIVVQAEIARGRIHAALDAAVEVLADSGLVLPRHPDQAQVMVAVGETLGVLGDRGIEDIARSTCDGDLLETARRRLLVRIASGAYVAEPNLLPLIACELVQRSVTLGVSRESSYGFGVFSLVLAAGWMLELGTLHGQNALWLLDAHPDRELEGAVCHVVHHFSRAFSDPLEDIHLDAHNVYRALMSAGDLEYSGWALHMRVVYGFLSGLRLDRLADVIDHALDFMRLNKVEAAMHCTLPFQQLVRGLRGETPDPSRLVSVGEYDETTALEALRAVDFRAAALVLATCMQFARLIAGDYAGARRATQIVMEFHDGALGTFYQCTMRVYGAIAELVSATRAGEPLEPTLDRVLAWRDPVAACAAHSPRNGAHLIALFDAELATARGDVLEASLQYDRAIEAAARAGQLHHEALAYERAADLHARRGAHKLAQSYLIQSRRGYERWGATAKLHQLDDAHVDLRAESERSARAPRKSETGSQEIHGTELDFASLLKASQAISEEIEIDRLLERSMNILLENVGARRGVLFLARRSELQVEAIGEVGKEVQLRPNVDEGDPSHAPDALIRRVWRTGAPELHDNLCEDATEAGLGDEPYLHGRSVLAVLCVRVNQRGRPLGVLYLENDLTSAAFSEQRLRVLDVLAPQLGTAIRNARLLAAQNRFVPYQFIRSLDRKDIVDVEVGDHRVKELSVFFSDIWGYTPLVERLSATEALSFLNRYLSYAEPAITNGRGFIDTYLGDGIMALFDEAMTNAQDAVTAGVALHRALDRFNEERRRNGERPVRTGVGINTGEVTLSTIGGQNSLKCGVVGDAVNLAARIEQLTRHRTARLLISDATRARLTHPGSFKLRRAGKVRVKGRSTPLTVLEVLDAEPEAVRDPILGCFDTYEAALSAYYDGRIHDALDGFTDCVSMAPGDPLARQFLHATEALVRDGLPDGWDGIEVLTRK